MTWATEDVTVGAETVGADDQNRDTASDTREPDKGSPLVRPRGGIIRSDPAGVRGGIFFLLQICAQLLALSVMRGAVVALAIDRGHQLAGLVRVPHACPIPSGNHGSDEVLKRTHGKKLLYCD
jgi:hypothetical protein